MDRIRIYQPDSDYRGLWTAALEEWDVDEEGYGILDQHDGDTPDDALAELRRENSRARNVPDEAIDR